MKRTEQCDFCKGEKVDDDGELCYLCNGKGEVPTIAGMAEQALKCQDASNGIALTSMLGQYSRIMMHQHSLGTTGAFQAAPCKLIFMHMTMLMGLPSIFDEYNAISHECERLVWEAKEEDYRPKEAVDG